MSQKYIPVVIVITLQGIITLQRKTCVNSYIPPRNSLSFKSLPPSCFRKIFAVLGRLKCPEFLAMDRFNPLEDYNDEAFRLRFRLRKDSVNDVVQILEKDLQHQTRRGLLLTPMQQVRIALRFYATGIFQRVIGDLFGVSVFCCTAVHEVSRAIAQQKRHFLSFPRTWLVSRESFMKLGTFQV